MTKRRGGWKSSPRRKRPALKPTSPAAQAASNASKVRLVNLESRVILLERWYEEMALMMQGHKNLISEEE